jgi:hypothetical protein
MNNDAQTSQADTTLLILGIASFLLYPFTAIPGIVIGKRQASLSSRGRVGYVLCWICMGLFCVHLIILGLLLSTSKGGG